MASDPQKPTATSSPAELSQLNPAEIAQLMVGSKPIEGPAVNAFGFFIMQAGNDAVIVFNRPKPVITPEGQVANIATNETTAIIYMSMATLKDLWLGIGQNLAVWETAHGEIKTDYMKLLDAQKK